MAGPIQVVVDDPRFPNGRATLDDLLASQLGTAPGQFLGCATTGWRGGAYLHMATKPLVGVVSTSGGGLLGFIPNEGNPVIYLHTCLYVVTKSTGAANLNIGVGATTTTSANNLITACDVSTNSGVIYDNITDVGASGKSRQLATGVLALTVTGSADTSGFVGILFVTFVRATNTGM